jgi:hypothetical protein
MQLAGLIERLSNTSQQVGLVTCSNCRVLMPRISLRGMEIEKGLNEAVYRCPQCNTETKRWIRF